MAMRAVKAAEVASTANSFSSAFVPQNSANVNTAAAFTEALNSVINKNALRGNAVLGK